jgi:transcriptional regulator with XRE-family HTH domain
VGVERNTVSRWENGGVLPKDPAVLAALARVLHVSADWLLGGFEAAPELGTTAAEGADRLREGSTTGYRPDTAELAKLPPAVAEVVRAYLQRLAAAGCTTEQLAGAESALLGGATNSISRRAFDERSDAEIAADVDAAWDFVSQVLRREGIRP